MKSAAPPLCAIAPGADACGERAGAGSQSSPRRRSRQRGGTAPRRRRSPAPARRRGCRRSSSADHAARASRARVPYELARSAARRGIRWRPAAAAPPAGCVEVVVPDRRDAPRVLSPARARSTGLVSTRCSCERGMEARHAPRRAQRIGHQRAAAGAELGEDERVGRAHALPADRRTRAPISSPKIWLISGAVMKSPRRAERDRASRNSRARMAERLGHEVGDGDRARSSRMRRASRAAERRCHARASAARLAARTISDQRRQRRSGSDRSCPIVSAEPQEAEERVGLAEELADDARARHSRSGTRR